MSAIMKAPTKLMKELKCAYTGKPADVRILMLMGKPRFYAEGAYSPCRPDTMANHLESLMRREGVSGVVDQPACFTCPYTGKVMKPVKQATGLIVFVGGFNPCQPLPKSEFVKAMFMRDGKEDPNAPVIQDAVDVSFNDPDRAPEDIGLASRDVARDLANEEAAKITHQRKTSLVVNGSKNQKKNPKKG